MQKYFIKTRNLKLIKKSVTTRGRGKFAGLGALLRSRARQLALHATCRGPEEQSFLHVATRRLPQSFKHALSVRQAAYVSRLNARFLPRAPWVARAALIIYERERSRLPLGRSARKDQPQQQPGGDAGWRDLAGDKEENWRGVGVASIIDGGDANIRRE